MMCRNFRLDIQDHGRRGDDTNGVDDSQTTRGRTYALKMDEAAFGVWDEFSEAVGTPRELPADLLEQFLLSGRRDRP